jgi:hypothetical protein
MREKRRALHEEQRKRRHPEIGHAILFVRSRPVIRERLHAMSQYVEQGLDWVHPDSESDSPLVGDPSRRT